MSDGGGSMKLPGRRLAALPSASGRVVSVSMRAAVAGLGVAVVFAGYLLLRPLPAAPEVAGPTVERPAAVDAVDSDSAERRAATQRLASAHAFSPYRLPLAELPRAAAVDGAVADGERTDEPAEARPEQRERVGAEREGVVVVEVASPEDVDQPVRESFNTIRLLGIHSTREGGYAALVSFMHGERANQTQRLADREEFEVPVATTSNKEPLTWRLTAVDPDRDRVLVSHGGETLAIAVFGTGDADLSPLEIEGASAAVDEPEEPIAEAEATTAEDGTRVMRRDRRDVIRRLEEAGEDASIEELFRLMGAIGGEEEGDEEEGERGGGEGGD